MAGQTYETYPLLRSCLECAAYGLHIGDNDTRTIIWLNRHDDDDSKKIMRSEFKNEKLKATISSVNDSVFSKAFELLYEKTIDYGGHPNQLGLHTGQSVIEEDAQTEFRTIFLDGDGDQLDSALNTTGLVGIWSLYAFQHVYPARFELLGVKHRLIEIRQNF